MSLTDLLVIAGLVVLVLGALTWVLILLALVLSWRKSAKEAKDDRKAPEGPFDLRHPSRGLHRRP